MSNSADITCRPVTAADYDSIAAFESFSVDDPWGKDLLASRLSNASTVGHIAEINGKMAAYMIYERNDSHHQNSIVKFAVTPGFTDQAKEIQEQLLDIVKNDMSADGRSHIVVYTKSNDQAVIDFFSDPAKGFQRWQATGSDHTMLVYKMPEAKKTNLPDVPNNNTPSTEPLQTDVTFDPRMLSHTTYASMMPIDDQPSRLVLPDDLKFLEDQLTEGTTQENTAYPPIQFDPIQVQGFEFTGNTHDITTNDDILYTAQEDEPMKARTANNLSAAALCEKARQHLTGLTHMEWETVSWGKNNTLEEITPDSHTDMSNVFLRTHNKVTSVKNAMTELCDFLGHECNASNSAKLNTSGQVTIPSSWVNASHLEMGKPGLLSESFKPASTQHRFQCHEEIEERQRRQR
jgi:hypothetical protein